MDNASFGYAKAKNTKFRIPLDKQSAYQGGKKVVERLIKIFNLRNRVELASLLGVTTGTIATWQTRDTTPFELLVRVHIATGISMEFLCFGEGDQNQDVYAKSFGSTVPVYGDDPHIPAERNEAVFNSLDAEANRFAIELLRLKFYELKNGQLKEVKQIDTSKELLEHFHLTGNEHDLVIEQADDLIFVNSEITTVVYGNYLFATNDNYQIGELRLLPNGKVYLVDNGERFPIDPNVTKVIGKVVSVLKKT